MWRAAVLYVRLGHSGSLLTVSWDTSCSKSAPLLHTIQLSSAQRSLFKHDIAVQMWYIVKGEHAVCCDAETDSRAGGRESPTAKST